MVQMICKSVSGFVTLFMLCPYVLGRQPPSEQQPPQATYESDQLSDDTGPTEAIRFDVSDQPEQLSLFRADPALLEQKFIAIVELRGLPRGKPEIKRTSLDTLVQRSAPDSHELAGYAGRSLLLTGISSTRYRRTGVDFFKPLAERVSPDAKVLDAALDFFCSSETADSGYIRFALNTVPDHSDDYFLFSILAPSEHVAKERAEALIVMLRRGIAEPVRNGLRKRLDSINQEIKSKSSELARAEEASVETQKKIEALPDIEGEELSQLKTARRLLDVELAGLRARVGAADRILARIREQESRSQYKFERIASLEDIKIQAEIDVAGVLARAGSLDELIDVGAQRGKLQQQLTEERTQRGLANQELAKDRQMQEAYLLATDAARELFELRNGHVRIAPIEWRK